MANQGRINFGIGFNIDKSGLNALKQSLSEIQGLTRKDLIDTSVTEKQLKSIQESASRVHQALNKSYNVKLNTYDIDAFKKAINSTEGSLSALQAKWKATGATGEKAFRNLADSLTSTNLNLKQTHSLLDSLGTTFMNTIKWSVASNAINTVTGSIQKAWGFTQDLDKSLNDIMIVTDKSSESMERFARQANKAAKELGKSTTDYTKASLIYYQQGLDDADVKARTETTLKAANITSQSTDAVSQQLTAVWNGYKVQAAEAELYVDKLSAVAATTAADLEELSTGMSKVASAANNMGVDIDQLNAQLATIISVTKQAPESVGTALKTVYARISDIEAGLDTETTLGEYTAQMAEMGIKVLDSNNHLRDMGAVIEEIGSKWTTLNREQQISLAQTMAGTRQYNNLLALFENWDMYTKAMQTSANATGTLQQQQEEYMESLEAHFEKLSTAGERVYNAFFDADSAKDLIDVLTEAIELLGNFTEAIGGGGNMLLMLGTIATRVFNKQISQSIATTANNFINMKQNAESLQTALNNVRNINKMGNLDEATKSILELKDSLIVLRQQSLITDETFNQLTADIDKVKEAANAASDLKAKFEGIDRRMSIDTTEAFKSGRRAGSTNASLASISKAASELMAEGLAGDDLIKANNEWAKYENSIKTLRQRATFEAEKQVAKGADGGKKDDVASIARNAQKATEEMRKYADNIANSSGLLAEHSVEQKNVIQAAQKLQQAYAELNRGVEAYQAALEGGNEKEIEKAKKKVFELRDAFNLVSKSAAVTGSATSRIANESADEVLVAAKSAAAGVVTETENASKQAAAAVQQQLSQIDLTKAIMQVTRVVTEISTLTTAISMLHNLGGIWENEDLTAGEKILQTVMNVSSAIGMLLPTITGFLAWQKKLAAEQTVNAIANIGLEKIQNELKKTSLSIEQQEVLLQAIKNGALTEEQIKQLKILGILKEQTKEQAKQAALEKIKGSFKDFGSGFKSGFTSGGGKGAFSTKGLSGAGAIGQIAGAAAPYLLIAAAIAAVSISVYNHLDNINKKEQKAYSEAQARTKALQANLERVNNEYDTLESSLDNLASTTDTFEKLTEGTVEWEKALSDVNAQVIELLGKYPELYEYVETDKETGLMSISAEGSRLVKQQQLEELKAARAGAAAAQLQENEAAMAAKRDALAEKATGGIGDAGAIAGWGTAGLGAAGGVIGGVAAGAAAGSIVPVVGTIIGAAIGLGAGLLGSAIGVGIQEAQEEEYKANLDEQAIGEAYAQVGAAMFESEEALAKALNTTKDALTDEQKALLENKDAAIALAETVAKNTAQQKALLLQVGRGLVGEDATEGEALRAGKEYKEAYSAELKKLQDNAGGNTQDKKEALEYLNILRLSEDNFVGTKGTNKIQYIDAQGNEVTKTMNEVYAVLAEDRAKKAADRIVAAIDKNFKAMNNALSGFSSEQKEILSTLGTNQFNLQNATKLDLEKFAELTDTQLQAIATANGVTLDEVKKQLETKLDAANTAWNSPSNLEGEVLSKFLGAAKNIKNLTLSQYTEYSNMFNELFTRFGDEGINTLYTILQQAGDSSDELLADILDTVSWESYEAQGQIYELIAKYDLSDKINMDFVDEYITQMLRLNGVYSRSSEEISKIATEIHAIIDGIKPGMKLTQEQYNTLAKHGYNMDQYTIASGDSDKPYIWTGNEAEAKARLEELAWNNAWGAIEGIDNEIEDVGTAFLNLPKELQQKKEEINKEASEQELLYLSRARKAADVEWIQFNQIGQPIYDADAKRRTEAEFYDYLQSYHSDNTILGDLLQSTSYSSLLQRAKQPGSTDIRNEVNRLYKQFIIDFDESFGSEDRPLSDYVQAKREKIAAAEEEYWNNLETLGSQLKELKASYTDAFIDGLEHLETEAQLQEWLEKAKTYLGEGENYEAVAEEAAKTYVNKFAQAAFSELTTVGALTAESLGAYLDTATKGKTGTEKLEAMQEVLAQLRLGTKKWDIAISDLEDSLTSLDYELEGLTGVNAFENISEQVDILNQQLALTEQKVNSLKDFNLDTLRAAGVALNTALAKSGYNFNVNNIVNEEGEINQGIYAAVLQMAAEHGDDAIGTALNTYITSIEQYIEQQKKGEEEIYKARKAYQDALCEEYEKWLETITSGDVIKKQINALQREIGELTGNRGLVAETLLGDFAINQNLISDYTNAYSELERKRKEGMSDQEYAEKLEALIAQHQEAILANAQAYLTASNQIVESLEEISALYDEQISYLEQLSALTETQANAYSLIYGDTNYARMAGYYERQLDYATQISNAAQANYEQLKSEIFNEDGSYTEMFNQLSAEAQATLLQQFADAGQASADAFYSELEARQQVWQNEIEVALDRMTKNLFGNVDFSLMKEQWEWMRDQGDKYFDSIERGYEMTSLSLMFDKAIADTKDIKAQQAIAQLKQEQLEHMESIVNLSEYDVTMAEKKLNLLQAEIALRDAEANKTQMRLMRGANGAYSYQYVADQNAINKAREELNKAQSDMYKFSKQSAEDAVSAFYQGYEDILELIRNFYADGTISEQEQKIIDEREAAWLANAEKSEQITSEFRDIMSASLRDFQGSLTGTSDITITEISNSISDTIAQLSNGGFQAAFNEIINGAGGLKETSEKFISEQEALFKQINKLLTGSDDGAGDSGLLSAITKIVNKYNGEDGLIAAETAEYNLLKDKLVPQLATLKANYENVGAAVAELIAKYHALAAAKAAVDNVSMPQHEDMSWFLHINPETNSTDWNGDGKVTMADYEAWRDNDVYGAKSSLLSNEDDGWSAEENDTAYGYQVSGNKHYADKHNRVTMDAYSESLLAETGTGKKSIISPEAIIPQNEPKIREGYWFNKGSKTWRSSISPWAEDSFVSGAEIRAGEVREWNGEWISGNPTLYVTDDTALYEGADTNTYIRVVPKGNPWHELYARVSSIQFNKKYPFPYEVSAYDTGGYTGAWGDSSGRLAMLHEKELVLNKVDTANILKAVDLVRSLESSMLNSMGQWQAGALASSAAWELAQDMVIEQNVHIEANFPNVSVKKEIEEAFEDIINLAAQYANEF